LILHYYKREKVSNVALLALALGIGANTASSASLTVFCFALCLMATLIDWSESGRRMSVAHNRAAINSRSPRLISSILLRGREFTDRDINGAPSVLIINESMQRRFWPDEDPLGKRIIVRNEQFSHEVIGIVEDVKHFGLDTAAEPQMYVPHAQFPIGFMMLVARTSVDPLSLASAVQNQVRAIDKDQPVARIRTMGQIVGASLSQKRFSVLLLSIFAAVALILAAVGLYGVMAYSVTQRTREIGIRMALGAQVSDIFKLVVGQGMLLVLIGISLGLAASFALTRVISSLLYNVSATDPSTFILISLTITAVALLALLYPRPQSDEGRSNDCSSLRMIRCIMRNA